MLQKATNYTPKNPKLLELLKSNEGENDWRSEAKKLQEELNEKYNKQ